MAPSVLIVDVIDKLQYNLPVIRETVERDGYAIVEAWDASESTLLAIAHSLGDIQRHVRANERGVVGEEPARTDWSSFPDEYQGLGTTEFPPHTDGTFLDGITLQGDTVCRVLPPEMLILQCVQPATLGGESVVVDGRRVVEDALTRSPELLRALLTTDVLYARDDMFSSGPAITIAECNCLRLRLRHDNKVYASHSTAAALRRLYDQYILQPAYQVVVALQPCQMLIVDNYRTLHGRRAFEVCTGEQIRKMRRVLYSSGFLGIVPCETSCHIMVPRAGDSTCPGSPKSV